MMTFRGTGAAAMCGYRVNTADTPKAAELVTNFLRSKGILPSSPECWVPAIAVHEESVVSPLANSGIFGNSTRRWV
jgi:hypothetical protein